MGFGVHLFGHKPDFVRKRSAMIWNAPSNWASRIWSATSPLALHRATGHDRVAFSNSGTSGHGGSAPCPRRHRARQDHDLHDAYHGHSDVWLAHKTATDTT
jgi:glutamate-1-semialdehyde aminotransferase